MGRRVSTLLVGLVLIAACGGGSGSDDDLGANPTTAAADDSSEIIRSSGDESSDTTQAADNDAAEGQQLPFESGEGYYEVDGKRIDAEWVVSCETDDQILNLLAWGGDGRALELDVSELEVVGMGENNYTGTYFEADLAEEGLVAFEADGLITGPDGAWYSEADSLQLALGNDSGEVLADPPYNEEGAVVSGSFTAEGDAEARSVIYEFTVPSQTFDCDQL